MQYVKKREKNENHRLSFQEKSCLELATVLLQSRLQLLLMSYDMVKFEVN